MNIQLDKQDNGMAYVAVTVEPADYEENVALELKKLRKQANIPGFRPGMVPQSIIDKKFRKSVMAEETYKKSYDLVLEYLKKEGIQIVGDIIPSEKQSTLDFDTATSFEYCYKIGISPEFEVVLSSEDVIEKIVLKPTDKMIQQYKESFLRRFAELKDVDEIESDEILTVTLDNGDIKIEDANLSLNQLSEEKRKDYVGKKLSDKMDVNITEVYPLPRQRAAVLSLKEEELDAVKPEFTMEITKIQRFESPELNDKFFEKAYPEKDVATAEQFSEKMSSELSNILNSQVKYSFIEAIKSYVLKKINVSLPDEFLKEWLFLINEGKFTHEDIEKEYSGFQKYLLWDLVSKKIVKDNNLTIDHDLLLETAKEMLKERYLYYGINDMPESNIQQYAEELLKDREKTKEVFEQALNSLVLKTIESKVSIAEKEMDSDQYAEYQKKNAETEN